jgi:nitronate monooxygenase
MAGGHLGFKAEQVDDPDFSLEKLVPEVVAAVQPYADDAGQPIPVIAAGGVYSGGDILKFLKLGAGGVQMGTRFVATHECDAAQSFKQAYLDAKESDITLIKSPVGLPGRAIRNRFTEKVAMGDKQPFTCPYHCIRTCVPEKSPYCIARALMNAGKGKLNGGFAFAGANAHRTQELTSVPELMNSLFA